MIKHDVVNSAYDRYTRLAQELFHVTLPTRDQRNRAKYYFYRITYGSDPFFWF